MMENLFQNSMAALSNMSDADKRDLQQTMNNEMQKMKIQEGDEQLFPTPSKKILLPSGFIFPQLSFVANLSRIIFAAVHNLTDVCFKKCITANISSAKLERQEESCGRNCVERFLDANLSVVKHLESLRSAA